MCAALTRKIARRKAIRVGVDKQHDDISKYVAAFNEEDMVTVRGKRRTLLEQIQTLRDLDDEILEAVAPEDMEKDICDTMEYYDRINITLEHLEIKLERGKDKKSGVEARPSEKSTPERHCRLPKLELPVFSGNPLKWNEFWDQFNASIHNNETINDIDRFSYLKRYLSGSALSTISGLKLTEGNYREAVTLLENRYGNEQVQISAHMESLLKIRKVASMENVDQLRTLYNDVENCVRNLKSLRVQTATYGSMLIPVLNERLPEELRILISRKFGSDAWTLDNMMVYLNEEIQAIERCATFSKGFFSEKEDAREDERKRAKGSCFTTANLHVNSDRVDRKKRCVYCLKDHPPSQCGNVTNVDARIGILRKYAKCFTCLQGGHTSRFCRSSYKCKKCNKKHHISICKTDLTKNDTKETQNTHTGVASNILLQTAKAEISPVGDGNRVISRLMFDTGSQRSYVSQNLTKRLKLQPLRSEKIVIKTFGTMNNKVEELNVVQFRVKNRVNDNYIYVEALCVPTICCPITRQNIQASQDEFKHLAELELADYSDGKSDLAIDILIGIDFYYSFVSNKIIRGEKGPIAVNSSLGWILAGCSGEIVDTSSHCTLLSCEVVDSNGGGDPDGIREQLQKFWSIESVGKTGTDCVIHEFEKDIEFDGLRYITKLPFRPDHDELPDNFSLCKRRLESLKKRLNESDNRELLENYDKIFREYEKDGIIERVPANEVTKDPGTVYYLPHHPVVRDDKVTTKIRPVFDASCNVNKPSLNDCLYAGPNLLPKIFDILLRFRMNYIALLADIKQAFLNVGISKEHQDYCRFLWVDNITEKEAETIILRFLRVLFGVNSSPFLLNATIRHHLEKYVPLEINFVEKFLEDLYVDDVTTGSKNVSEGVVFYRKAKQIMADGGFNLRKWVTNNRELQAIINENEGTKSELTVLAAVDDSTFVESLFPKVGEFHKVLGLEWDISTDEFVFRFKPFVDEVLQLQPTKRNILRAAASLYDPLGSITPVTTRVKLIFQLLCCDKHEWDDIAPGEVKVIWKEFLDDLRLLGTVRVERFAFHEMENAIVSVELHAFADSSQQAYAGVIYIRIKDAIGIRLHLLASKSKVAPLKVLSIPRLELLACLLLVTLLKDVTSSISNCVKVDDVIGWSDSKVSLCWIKGKSKPWKPWVENRVVAIREVIPVNSWHYVESGANPADIPTRANNFNTLVDGRWFNGPEFLRKENLKMDIFDENEHLNATDVVSEAKKSPKVSVTCIAVNGDGEKKLEGSLSELIDVERYSSLKKLIMVTGYVMRFVNNLMVKIRKRADKIIEGEVLELHEYNNAIDVWVKDEQLKLSNSENFKKIQASLNLFQDAYGFWRLRGRFGNSAISYVEKHPILLRDSSYFTKLMILNAHNEVMHHGIESTGAKFRSRFWIRRGRVTVKNILRKCIVCKKMQGKTCLPPVTPDLPEYRINTSYSFQATGLDYAGPLLVRDIMGKNHLKVYILLFTCATSRGIHLELTPNMKNQAFIRGFTRFMARRGVPKLIINDNFKTFKSIDVRRFMVFHGVEQKFILPASPWWGGFYERFVRTVKLSLKKVVGKALLTFEELETVLCKIEQVINGRPLVYVNEDDLGEAITPFHLMVGRNLLTKPSHHLPYENFEFSKSEVSRRAQHLQKVIHDYWGRFKETYLNELRQHHMYNSQKSNNENKLQIGDVVLIRDDATMPRTRWKMGLVEKLATGKDGHVRGAMLAVISETGKRTNSWRPLQKLIPFEITNNIGENDKNNITLIDSNEVKAMDNNEIEPMPRHVKTSDIDLGNGVDTEPRKRPRRRMAIAGEELRRLKQLYG